ncbi:hypothetical protein BGZ73_004540 [Actinomortierella ambigua]|nr:hypothetical protein BGZ73_004540 [Actinomortierella ambigua]
MIATAMAKVRCQCSDDGNSINKPDTLTACQTGMGYGVEADGFCYIIDNSLANQVLSKCPARDFSYCQVVV